MEHCCLPTEVVPNYLLGFAFFWTARLAGAGAPADKNKSSLHHMVFGSRTANLSPDKLCILTTNSLWPLSQGPTRIKKRTFHLTKQKGALDGLQTFTAQIKSLQLKGQVE
uniref:Uncharacterized protein n=1 Tax=Micrurus lemniscatus lemniscatus TaxID=129467 RepID=A0A2D4IXV4_MICLE